MRGSEQCVRGCWSCVCGWGLSRCRLGCGEAAQDAPDGRRGARGRRGTTPRGPRRARTNAGASEAGRRLGLARPRTSVVPGPPPGRGVSNIRRTRRLVEDREMMSRVPLARGLDRLFAQRPTRALTARRSSQPERTHRSRISRRVRMKRGARTTRRALRALDARRQR